MQIIQLKQQIEKKTQVMMQENEMFKKSQTGELNEEHISYYLNSVIFLLQNTPVCLNLGVDSCKEKKNSQLELFFKEKIEEEIGHDQWAEEDLSQFKKFYDPQKVSHHIKKMVDSNKEMCQETPYLYLAYILFTEYFMVLAGPEFLNNLEHECKIPRQFLTVVSKHMELDADHVDDDIDAINDVLQGQDLLNSMEKVIDDSFEYVDHFFSEVAKIH